MCSSDLMIDQRIQSPPGHSRRLLSAGGGSVSNEIGSQQLHHLQNMHLNHDDDNHLPGPSHIINNNNNGTGSIADNYPPLLKHNVFPIYAFGWLFRLLLNCTLNFVLIADASRSMSV